MQHTQAITADDWEYLAQDAKVESRDHSNEFCPLAKGRYYADYFGQPEDVSVFVAHGMLYLRNEQIELAFPLDRVDATRGLSAGPVLLRLPNHKACEIESEEKFQQLLKLARQDRPWQRFVRKYCMRGLVWGFLIVLPIGVTYQMLAPRMARTLAAQIPLSWVQEVSVRALTELDNSVLAPSTLSAERQDQLRSRFAAWRAPEQGAPPYTILFRKGNRAGAQSYALPSGEIVITDELIALAKNDDEILSIFAYQLGHQYYKHSLRRMTRNTLFSTLWNMYFDKREACVNWLTNELLHSTFSSDEEAIAASYAKAMMTANAIPADNLFALLDRVRDSVNTIPSPASLLLYDYSLGLKVRNKT